MVRPQLQRRTIRSQHPPGYKPLNFLQIDCDMSGKKPFKPKPEIVAEFIVQLKESNSDASAYLTVYPFQGLDWATTSQVNLILRVTMVQVEEKSIEMQRTAKQASKVLRVESMQKDIVRVEYAVRGEIAIRAEELRKQLSVSPNSLPFTRITNCNIGNPQQLAQRPITFFRQVAALVDYPDLLRSESDLFKPDARERAAKYLAAIGSAGAYSHSQGVPIVRREVADFIEKRDGFAADPENIFLTAGASPAVQLVLNSLISHPKVGIMIPIPQYPLYTASIALFNGTAVPYYLDEAKNWGLSKEELARSLSKARSEGVEVRALCIINPGNPTGQCLSLENMNEVVEFCKKENIVLLADEVYQTNIYKPAERPFHSFKKVVKSKGPEYDNFELISFHSVSKGMVGECGRRGGYFECTNIDPE
ncbi:hypothetical protein CcCBS67573_g10166, partial [Chytriomyces confervae]